MADHQNELVPSPKPSDQVPTNNSNRYGFIFPPASRTNATYTSDALYNSDHKGIRLSINANNVGVGGTLIVSVECQDPVSSNWVPVTGGTTSVGTPFNAVQTITLTIYPGNKVAAGDATTSTEVSNFVDAVCRVKVVVGVNAVTFSVGGVLLL